MAFIASVSSLHSNLHFVGLLWMLSFCPSHSTSVCNLAPAVPEFRAHTLFA
ncbi:hypothetical protein M758_7G182500 [Ceratodon purpureus]|uniref:Uncharacterized protein n=1 Tax=Ceratodon purpureus TaxID=3225 RepID=A0A8T0H823_CERPU|nr:hypothetical protein KC19_7G184900 [Ceratodon purpureus]KAG0612000.1 hypothetical protein M758_7G182500 [Ceratodon purpureus]